MDLTPARHVCACLPINDLSGVGEARRFAMQLAGELQFGDADAGRVALIITEAATNIVHYAGHGEVLLRRLIHADAIEMLVLDRGPGMANVAASLRDGQTSGRSAGLGLGAIARLSTDFDIFSAPGAGTAILSRVRRPGAAQGATTGGSLESGAVCVAKRGEEVCGDAWGVAGAAGRDAVLIIDGLGHGLHAFDAAQEALRVFWAQPDIAGEALITALHEALRTTRGGVAAVTTIDWGRRELYFVGIGNIAGSLVPPEGKPMGLASHPGTLGHNVAQVQAFTHGWPDDGLIILHSDGLSSRWSLEPYPGLSRKDPSLIAGVLYRDFARRSDDVVVFVGRERRRHSPPDYGGPGVP